MPRILIAGFGSIGRRHFRNLLALGQTDILFYRSHRSTIPLDELAGYPVETDLARALGHRPAAVIVANPTASHLDVAIPAAKAGCHLLLEKPVSHDAERLDELESALQQGGGQALVGYQFRFHPVLQRLKAFLDGGAIGRPLSARAHWGEYLPGWHPWEDYRSSYSARADLGGGVALTLSHPIDYLRWLFGAVEAVWAFAGHASPLELDVEDFVEAGLRFRSGLHASLHLDYFQRPPAHRLEVIGTEGTLAWDNNSGAALLYPAGTQAWQTIEPPAGFERNMLFLDELRHFLDVVSGAASPLCTLQDGRAALQLTQAMLQSARSGSLVSLTDG